MKSYVFFILAIAVSWIVFSCQEDDSVGGANSLGGGGGATTPADVFGIGGPWPPPSDDLAQDQLADNYLVVMDDSSSMQGQKMSQAKNALKECVKFIPEGANLGYMILNNDNLLLPFGNSRDNRAKFQELVSGTYAEGGTPLLRTLENAYRYLAVQAAAQKGYGSYHLIIVTDGESGDGDPVYLTKQIVNGSLIEVHVIGFHIDEHSMNLPGFVDYHTARSAKQLQQAFEAVTAETEQFVSPAEFEAM